MNYIFIHQNMPGQYKHIVRRLAANKKNNVVFITKRKEIEIPGVRKIVYDLHREPSQKIHHYLGMAEKGILYGQQVARELLKLSQQGFRPDIIVGHPGWGEMLYVKEVFPNVPVLAFFEFYYRARGSDVGFEPNDQPNLNDLCRIRTKNIVNDISLGIADAGVSPTLWQYEQLPAEFRYKVSVIFDGIDSDAAKPNPEAVFGHPRMGNLTLSAKDKVVTYVTRNFEPYRGFQWYMRALEILCKRHPDVQFVLVGADEVSYGKRPPKGQTYRQQMLAQLDLDRSRVHFVGMLPYEEYLKVLQISSCHVYLTYPFVLSWSLMESLSAGCLVVGSRTAPVEEMITDGENGLLVDFFDSQAIAARVTEVLENQEGLAPIREMARKFILDQYSLDKCLPQHHTLINNLVAGHRPKPAQQSGKPGVPVYERPKARKPLFPRTLPKFRG
ncbi:MAG: glycosyltransferase family 4 protein [Magnetospiraceae bacterium]